MSEIHYAREPNRGASELSAQEILATRQFVAAISSDADLGSPAELLLKSVTDEELLLEDRRYQSSGFWQDPRRFADHETMLRHSVASRRATQLLLNLSKISETPDEIAFMVSLWSNPVTYVNRGVVPPRFEVFHLGIKVADSHPEHASGMGMAVASMVKSPRLLWSNYLKLTDVSLGSAVQQYKNAVENGSEGAAAFVQAYLQNKPSEMLGVMYTLSEITSVLSAIKFSDGNSNLVEMAGKLEAYKLGIFEPRKKQKDSLQQSSDCVRAAAALTVNLIDYLSRDQPEDSNASKLKSLLDSQRLAHRDMLGSDMAFINIANGILRSSGSETLPGKSIEAFGQALGIVVDAAIADSRLKDKNEYADLVRSCSNRLIEIAILRNNFLPKVTADTKAVPPGKVPAIKTTTRGEYRNSKDARTPGYGTIS